VRPKVVFSILLVAALALGGGIFLKRLSSPPLPDITATPVATAPVPAAPPVSVPLPVITKKAATPEERRAAIHEESERLAVWSMNNDLQSLSNILGDLTSPEKEIRMAAIEATKQFDSTNAIPVLKAMAANTDDHEEAIALLEAADFLSLPDVDLRGNGVGMPADASPANGADAPRVEAPDQNPPP